MVTSTRTRSARRLRRRSLRRWLRRTLLAMQNNHALAAPGSSGSIEGCRWCTRAGELTETHDRNRPRFRCAGIRRDVVEGFSVGASDRNRKRPILRGCRFPTNWATRPFPLATRHRNASPDGPNGHRPGVNARWSAALSVEVRLAERADMPDERAHRSAVRSLKPLAPGRRSGQRVRCVAARCCAGPQR